MGIFGKPGAHKFTRKCAGFTPWLHAEVEPLIDKVEQEKIELKPCQVIEKIFSDISFDHPSLKF
jgi:hypothetical protein